MRQSWPGQVRPGHRMTVCRAAATVFVQFWWDLWVQMRSEGLPGTTWWWNVSQGSLGSHSKWNTQAITLSDSQVTTPDCVWIQIDRLFLSLKTVETVVSGRNKVAESVCNCFLMMSKYWQSGPSQRWNTSHAFYQPIWFARAESGMVTVISLYLHSLPGIP